MKDQGQILARLDQRWIQLDGFAEERLGFTRMSARSHGGAHIVQRARHQRFFRSELHGAIELLQRARIIVPQEKNPAHREGHGDVVRRQALRKGCLIKRLPCSARMDKDVGEVVVIVRVLRGETYGG